MFEHAWIRFALSGTLIGAYNLAELLMRRRSVSPPPLPQPWWLRVVILASITGFYLLIRPAGGPLSGGLGNAAGIALVAVAIFARPDGFVRHPRLARRCLFYLALPIGVGVPWGLLVLTAPACAVSVYSCLREERAARASEVPLGEPAAPAPRAPYRLVPGIW